MKEHYATKLKRELLEAKQQLFEVCNNPESEKSMSIIAEQRFLKSQGDAFMMGGNYYDKYFNIMKKRIEFREMNSGSYDSDKSRTIEIDEFGIMESHSIVERMGIYQECIDNSIWKIRSAINKLPLKLSK